MLALLRENIICFRLLNQLGGGLRGHLRPHRHRSCLAGGDVVVSNVRFELHELPGHLVS